MDVMNETQLAMVSGGDEDPNYGNAAIDSADDAAELYDKAVAAATDLIEEVANFFGD